MCHWYNASIHTSTNPPLHTSIQTLSLSLSLCGSVCLSLFCLSVFLSLPPLISPISLSLSLPPHLLYSHLTQEQNHMQTKFGHRTIEILLVKNKKAVARSRKWHLELPIETAVKYAILTQMNIGKFKIIKDCNIKKKQKQPACYSYINMNHKVENYAVKKCNVSNNKL